MKICNLHKLEGRRTWMWRTVEGNKGDYYTNPYGEGMFFQRDDGMDGGKLLSFERFKVCKTPGGTRKKLNAIFAAVEADPCDDPDFIEKYFKPQFKTRLKCVSNKKNTK